LGAGGQAPRRTFKMRARAELPETSTIEQNLIASLPRP
jgi:hypothetical protein